MKKTYSSKLDQIDEISIETDAQFFRLLRFGFEINHPKCYDWTLFHHGIQSLKSKRVMICFAKISAFYFSKEDNLIATLNFFRENFPEETFIKNLCYQIHSLIQSHEVSLSKTIKKELTRLQRKCVRCRSLMRYMWQNVICNDLSHIDRLALLLYTHTKSIEESYAHILLNYSHNTFVVKSYAYFLSDVMQKQAESKYWINVEKMLRSGKRVKNERSQIISKMVMGKYLKEADFYIVDKLKEEPTLDDIVDKLEKLVIYKYKYDGQASKFDIQNQLQQNEAAQIEEFNKDDDERKKNQLELLIKNVRLPSMKYMTILVFISFSLIIPFLIIIPFIISFNHASISQTAFLSIVQSGSLAPAFIQTLIIGFLTVISSTDLLSPLVSNFKTLKIPPDLWPKGWTNETTNEMIHVLSADELRTRVNDINSLISQVSLQKYYYDSIVAPFYADQFDYSVYDASEGFEGNRVPILIKKMKLSMESILALYISLSYRITRFHESDKWFYGQSQDFMNIEANSDIITSNLNQYTSIIINLALQDRKSHSDLLTSILTVTTVLIVVVSVITWIIVSYFIERDSKKVYSILQFVPKNEISAVMHILSPKEEEESNFDDKESGLRNNAQRTLITPVGRYKNNWFSIVKVIVTLLIIIIACLNLSIQVYLKNVSIDVPFSAAPLIFHCGQIHTQIGTIIHNILLYISKFMMIEVNQTELLKQIDTIMNETLPNLDEFRFGGESNSFYKGINSINAFFADKFSERLCDWPIDNFFYANIFFCENYETSLSYILSYIRILMESDPALEYDLTYMCPIICWFFKKSYEQFVMPTEDFLMEMFSEQVVSYKQNSMETSIITALCLFIIGVILTVVIPRVAYPVYNCLRLLLFIDLKIVYTSKPIMKLLSNDFSKFKSSKSSLSNFADANFDKYYDFISSMDDSVLIASNEGIIVAANKAALDFLSNSKKTKFFQDEKTQPINNEPNLDENQGQKKKKIHKRKKFFGSTHESNLRDYLINDNAKDDDQINSQNDTNANFDENFGQSIIGKSATDVIQNRKFTRIFNITQNQGFQPSFEISLSNDDSIHLTSIAVLHTGEVAASKDFTTNCIAFYCFIISDRIERSNLSKQLEEETIKCRKIISSFFPEKLADYIQTDLSENLELTVQNATVVFIEITQFAPFYFTSEKVPADIVSDDQNLAKLAKSNVLSRFVSELDRIIEKHPKMARVKTLGGCYMAVGGIFDIPAISSAQNVQSARRQALSARAHHSYGSTGNMSGMGSNNNINAGGNDAANVAPSPISGLADQPQSLFTLRSSSFHAVDAVSFALDAIAASQVLAMELNMQLRCRAGVHTCGPLSAGVVGEEQPSFEVVGSGISIAMTMKDTAAVNSVHITDSVCNLILSGGFKIREADDIIIGEKSIKTFVVTDYANK